MRVLFTVQPLTGHFHAMVPLALALQTQGHDVAFATGERFGPTIQRTGFHHFPCGRDNFGSRDVFTDLPNWSAIMAKVPHHGIRQLWGFIQGYGPQMADDLIALMDVWKPDVIVRDPTDFGSTILAELFDLPYATIQWAIYISDYGCDEPLAALRQRFGLSTVPEPDSFDRYFVLNALPPSWPLLGANSNVIHRFCMPPFDRSVPGDLPTWVNDLPDQPTVYATLGTAFNEMPDRFRTLIDALSAGDFNTIITVGQSMDPAQFQPLPPHVKMERYIPQTLILPYCDALVFHGGFNSLHSALWHGLPMVITPLGAGDQQLNGLQCTQSGAGIMVEGEHPEPAAIYDAIRSVLGQPRFRQQARQLQQELKELPDLTEAVQRLEILAATHEPQVNAHL